MTKKLGRLCHDTAKFTKGCLTKEIRLVSQAVDVKKNITDWIVEVTYKEKPSNMALIGAFKTKWKTHQDAKASFGNSVDLSKEFGWEVIK